MKQAAMIIAALLLTACDTYELRVAASSITRRWLVRAPGSRGKMSQLIAISKGVDCERI